MSAHLIKIRIKDEFRRVIEVDPPFTFYWDPTNSTLETTLHFGSLGKIKTTHDDLMLRFPPERYDWTNVPRNRRYI
jgi:hypothetical protein